ncbi:zinc finger protein 502-like [Malaya genurostris]|uniref:zinc finger protein 502-like n=1 Tax=Malaya genurostris TaxID=325434 RepID=UPI0026F3A731|nr:zinc finger protein 502-like [Malaya genurostris]
MFCSREIEFFNKKLEQDDNYNETAIITTNFCQICLCNPSRKNCLLITEEQKLKLMELSKNKMHCEDPYHICINCSNVLDILLDFSTAAVQANALLLTGKVHIECDDWYQQDHIEAVGLCRDLIRTHRRRIEAIYKNHSTEILEKNSGLIDSSLLSPATDIKLEPQYDIAEELTSPLFSDDHRERKKYEYCKKTTTSNSDDDTPDERNGVEITFNRRRRRRGRKPKEHPEFMSQLCDFCGKRVCGESAEGHKNQHLGIKPYSCTVSGCALTFFGRYNRLRHIKRMHSENGVEVHNCHICGKSIRGPSRTLKYHLHRHERNQKTEKDFICKVCGKGFTLQRYLTQHSIIHSGEFPHKCNFCGKKFNNKWGMRKHEKNIHEEPNR